MEDVTAELIAEDCNTEEVCDAIITEDIAEDYNDVEGGDAVTDAEGSNEVSELRACCSFSIGQTFIKHKFVLNFGRVFSINPISHLVRMFCNVFWTVLRVVFVFLAIANTTSC